VNLRARDEIARYLTGFRLVEPGLVSVMRWRPDEAGGSLKLSGYYGAVGVKEPAAPAAEVPAPR
jgi:hypothetical protein